MSQIQGSKSEADKETQKVTEKNGLKMGKVNLQSMAQNQRPSITRFKIRGSQKNLEDIREKWFEKWEKLTFN